MRGRVDRRLLVGLAAWLTLTQSPQASAEERAEEAERCYRIPRQQSQACVARFGVWRLALPEQMKLSVDLQRDLERWLVSELVTAGFQAEGPTSLQSIWEGVEKQIRPRLAAPVQPKQTSDRNAPFSEEMGESLRLHGRHELRRSLRLDALVVPSIVVVPGPLSPLDPTRREAAVCLVARVTDLDGAMLYEDAGCLGVVEKMVADGIQLRASAKALGSAVRRRYVAAEALRVLLGRAGERPRD